MTAHFQKTPHGYDVTVDGHHVGTISRQYQAVTGDPQFVGHIQGYYYYEFWSEDDRIGAAEFRTLRHARSHFPGFVSAAHNTLTK